MKNLFLSLAVFLLSFLTQTVHSAEVKMTEQWARMEYDALNRLTNIWYSNGWREIFTYDAVGNRIRHQVFGPPEITTVFQDRKVMPGLGRKVEIPFEISHKMLPTSNLTVKVESSNPLLIGTNNIVLGGNGSRRSVVITPIEGKTGEATISVFVTDGFVFSPTNRFKLIVQPNQPGKGY